MKTDDVLALPKLSKSLRKKMKGGKTEKKVPFEYNQEPNMHVDYNDADRTIKDKGNWNSEWM